MDLSEQIRILRKTTADSTIIKQLGLKSSNFYKIVAEYDIPKLSNNERNLNALIQRVSKQELQKYYVEENHSFEETQKYFNIKSGLPKLIKIYNLHKDTDKHIENIRKTKQKRYGDANYNNQVGRAQTNLEKYGVDNQFKRVDMMTEIRAANELKYGSKNNITKNLQTRAANAGSITQSYQNQVEKIRNTCLDRYGVDWAAKAAIVKDHIRESLKETFISKYGCENYWLTDDAKRSNGSKNSKANLTFEKLLQKYKISYEKEFHLENRIYDFKVSDYLIEINPTATHNSTWSPWCENHGLEKYYHANKSELAIKHNYRCIHIWDWENPEIIIKLLLQSRTTIYARKCSIQVVNIADEIEFLDNYHIQGYTKSQVALGLYYENKLVELMTFGKARYSKKYDIELIRLCSCANIIGGAERLFKYYIDNYNPKSIVSYCDLSKFTGSVYKKLGFKRNGKTISRHWYNIKLKDHITDKLLFKRGFDNLLGHIFGKYGSGTSNEILMLTHGFVEVFDAGQATYVWTKPEQISE